MELTMTVRGWKGGVDLTIRFGLRHDRQGETQKVDQFHPGFFTCNDFVTWAQSFGLRSVSKEETGKQATFVFNVLYAEALEGRLPIEHRCASDTCIGKACKKIHELSGRDFARLRVQQLESVPKIKRGNTRFKILEGYYMYQRGEAMDTAEG